MNRHNREVELLNMSKATVGKLKRKLVNLRNNLAKIEQHLMSARARLEKERADNGKLYSLRSVQRYEYQFARDYMTHKAILEQLQSHDYHCIEKTYGLLDDE